MTQNPFAPYAAQHVSTNGPGDSRPTALQIVQDEGLIGALSDKVILITGAASGIGVETARALHETGAKVYIAVRNVAKGKEVAAEILSRSENKAAVEVLDLDLSSLASVRACAQEFLSKESQLNLLIENAGVMAIPERQESVDGFEMQFATNHLGHFLLFQLLKPLLLSSASPSFESRVVAVSSSGHKTAPPDFSNLQLTHDYTPWLAYAYSKTAMIWTTNLIQRRYASRGLTANALNPGGIATPLQKHIPEETKQGWTKDEKVVAFMKSTEQGAATTVWAALGKVWKGKGGEYLEDCAVAQEVKDTTINPGGWAAHAKDLEGEARMWKVSCELVGVKDE